MMRFLLTLTAVIVLAVLAIAYVVETARDKVHPPQIAAIAPFDFLRLS
jgi:hypothetical protein